MAVAYESIQSTTATTTATLVITKPTGLAVGDYLFAQVFAQGTVFSTPSGWTALYNSVTTMSGGNLAPAVFYKQADSADVAASNFSFGNGVSNIKTGSLMRVSGGGVIDDSSSVADGDPSAIDPTFANNLAIAFLFGGDNTTNTIAITGFSIATSNPTWTSRSSDAISNISNSLARNVFTASRPETTDWGTATMTYTQSGSGIGSMMVLVALAPIINGSHSVTTAPMYVVNQPFLRSGVLEINATDPETMELNKTEWQNEPKPSTTWINDPL